MTNDINLEHSSIGTLYHSVGQIIRSNIQSGEWGEGDQIPTERELIETYNVSRATIRQGIDNLVREGMLYRVQGKGTFVAPKKIEHGVLGALNFSNKVKEHNINITSKVLSKDIISPPKNVRKNLKLNDGDEVIWLQRLLYVDNDPLLIETSFFTSWRFPDFCNKLTPNTSPYDFIYDEYAVRIIRVKESFEPVMMEKTEADTLGVASDSLGLWIEHLAFDEKENPVIFLTVLLRGDRCKTYTNIVLD